MKQFNDVVTYVRNGVELPAFVVESRDVAGEERLQVAYLDPDTGKQKLAHDGAVSRAYGVPPLKDGAVNGWKESAGPDLNKALLKLELKDGNLLFVDAAAINREAFTALPDNANYPDVTVIPLHLAPGQSLEEAIIARENTYGLARAELDAAPADAIQQAKDATAEDIPAAPESTTEAAPDEAPTAEEPDDLPESESPQPDTPETGTHDQPVDEVTAQP